MKKIRSIITSSLAIACTAVMIGSASVPASATNLYGDVNGDGRIDLSDSITYGKYLRGEGVLSNYTVADLNQNYVIDGVDQEILLAFLVGSIHSIPLS